MSETFVYNFKFLNNLIRWRFESGSTRDHLVDAAKTINLPPLPIPRWHKRLCVHLTNAFTHYIEMNCAFSGFQLIQVGKPRAFNDG